MPVLAPCGLPTCEGWVRIIPWDLIRFLEDLEPIISHFYCVYPPTPHRQKTGQALRVLRPRCIPLQHLTAVVLAAVAVGGVNRPAGGAEAHAAGAPEA